MATNAVLNAANMIDPLSKMRQRPWKHHWAVYANFHLQVKQAADMTIPLKQAGWDRQLPTPKSGDLCSACSTPLIDTVASAVRCPNERNH